MEGHHEVRKSLSLWHLSKKWVVSLVNTLRLKCFFSAQGENGPWWAGGKVWNHFGWEKGRRRHELWVISKPVVWSKWPISEELPDLYFVCVGIPFWIEYLISPACSVTVADRSAMRGCAWAGKQLSSCGWLELSKVGKDYEITVEGWECFLKEGREDKRDGVNLSDYRWQKWSEFAGVKFWIYFLLERNLAARAKNWPFEAKKISL